MNVWSAWGCYNGWPSYANHLNPRNSSIDALDGFLKCNRHQRSSSPKTRQIHIQCPHRTHHRNHITHQIRKTYSWVEKARKNTIYQPFAFDSWRQTIRLHSSLASYLTKNFSLSNEMSNELNASHIRTIRISIICILAFYQFAFRTHKRMSPFVRVVNALVFHFCHPESRPRNSDGFSIYPIQN